MHIPRLHPKPGPTSSLLGLALAAVMSLSGTAQAALVPDETPNFAMLDVHGRYYELHRTGAKAVVLLFTENGCPVARQTIQKLKTIRTLFPESDVAIWAVDANTSDDRKSIYNEAKELGANRIFPFLRDDSQGVAQALGVTRTATVVAISGKDGHIFYHGALDDQLTEGASKPEPQAHYLEDALHAFLAGNPVQQATTPAHGCLIHFDAKLKGTDVSYAHDVAPILQKHCVQCHSPGNIGPFAISDYEKVKSKSAMIQEVLLARRMPPWSADPKSGHFLDERTMTLDETRTLLAWVAQGAPRGEGEDPLAGVAVAPASAWTLGQPDFMAKLPAPEEIPATGVLEYRHIKVQTSVTEDTWLGAIVIHPGNLKVLHHCIVRVQSHDGSDDGSGRGMFLQGWAPGYRASRFPEGTGRLLPKGAVLDFEIHYTTMGSPQTDQTEVGFYKLPEKPQLALEVHGAYNTEFSIAPNDPDSETFASYAVKADTQLFAMAPHMHLRGSWMRYEALYPNGKRETLLSVPHYDFNWQTSYRLPQPKSLPAGTWIICSGGFDNSPQNPNNPAPASRVAWGDQSFDEMFIGFVETADAPLTSKASSSRASTPAP
ncbi:MAG: Peroxiredoxin [Pedosphaera sp.]|nr:Peroxiredoxin [Pedosphaera sp.]